MKTWKRSNKIGFIFGGSKRLKENSEKGSIWKIRGREATAVKVNGGREKGT